MYEWPLHVQLIWSLGVTLKFPLACWNQAEVHLSLLSIVQKICCKLEIERILNKFEKFSGFVKIQCTSSARNPLRKWINLLDMRPFTFHNFRYTAASCVTDKSIEIPEPLLNLPIIVDTPQNEHSSHAVGERIPDPAFPNLSIYAFKN